MFRKKDILIQPYRSSGPGGQRKNRKQTSVRIIHIPTGVVVTACESRSQAHNIKTGLARLEKRLSLISRKRKKRIPTHIPERSKEKRLFRKKLKSEKKILRNKIISEENSCHI